MDVAYLAVFGIACAAVLLVIWDLRRRQRPWQRFQWTRDRFDYVSAMFGVIIVLTVVSSHGSAAVPIAVMFFLVTTAAAISTRWRTWQHWEGWALFAILFGVVAIWGGLSYGLGVALVALVLALIDAAIALVAARRYRTASMVARQQRG